MILWKKGYVVLPVASQLGVLTLLWADKRQKHITLDCT